MNSRIAMGVTVTAVVAAVCFYPVRVAAQPAAVAPAVEAALPAGQAPAPTQTAPSPAPAPPDSYTYNPAGRRDPFISLVSRGTDLRATGARPAGLAGVLINEVTVKGIVRSNNTFVAMLQAPDNRTYVVRPNARLLDGSVKAITADMVLFSQDVNDPLSLVKEREVRKTLRPMEDVK